MERKQQYADEAVASTSTAPAEVPPKRPRESQESSHTQAEVKESDQVAMDDEAHQELHSAIEKGYSEVVNRILQEHPEEQYFSYDDTSALFKAFSCEEYDIVSFLIHKGAKIHDSEVDDLYSLDLTRLNHLLSVYNRKTEKSCIFQLISWSQSPQGLDGERLSAVVSMYEKFFESEIIKFLMMVLESEAFDIVFDFSSDDVNRVYRLDNAESEVFGLTLSNSKEIFIGSRNMLSDDPWERAKVHGVVAEELCHLALTMVFENSAKAYREEDTKLYEEFWAIVGAVKSLEDNTFNLESVIKDVFVNYKKYSWECELIARVPHVVGIYGEDSARKIFQESDELSMLLEFYDQNVLPKCRQYTDTLLNTKSHRIRKQLMGKNEFISFREKQIPPLIDERYPSFRKYVVVQKGVSVFSTNCIKLSILHVYHELKTVCGDQFERKCLFFSSECFEKKREVILNALRCKLCQYLVLVLDNKELHHQRLIDEYLEDFQEFENDVINIIIISNSQFLGPEFEGNFVEYKWGDLTDEYKDLRTHPIEYIFKGERESVEIKKEDVPKLFLGEDIFHLISGDMIEVRDHADLNCQGYNLETYVERQFEATIIDNNIFKSLPNDSSFLIYGSSDFVSELSIDKRQVQWLKESDDEIKEGKTIFIDNRKRPMNFEDFVEKTAVKNRICLQYYKEVFYLMNSEGDVWKQHQKEIRQTEGEIIDWLKNKKTLIISDNAGSGKSTVMSRLIWHVRKKYYNSWVLRVDLNKFSIEDEGADSEEDDKEELFEDIFDMLGLENGFQKCHFRHTYNQVNYYIYLDALDEIQSKYKSKALKLIAFLRRKTNARIIITTRMHHQQELEEILNAFSHQLVPFDNLSQVHCLGKLWKWKLKFPTGEGSKLPQKEKKAMSRKIASIIRELEKEKDNFNGHDLILTMKEIKLDDSLDSIRKKIDGLNFSELAKYILKKTCLDRETVQFMGIPLHLFMIGSIYFDSNFKLEINSGIYSIYSKFIHLKIRIYVEEKQGISYQGRGKEIIIKRDEIDAYRIHIDLANQVMVKGKIDINNMNKDDLELCASLGIAFIKGEQIDFLHHTFAEYFRAESIRKNLKKDEFTGVLFDDKYEVVRRFLLSSLEENKFENLTGDILKDLEFLFCVLKDFVGSCGNVFGDHRYHFKFGTIAKIVKHLLECFEFSVDLNCLNEFVLALSSELTSFRKWYVIGGCLTVNMMKILFNQSNDNQKLMCGVVKYYANPKEIIELMSEWISIEISGECDSNERENEKRKAESLLRFLKVRVFIRPSLFECAVWNERMESFAKILEFSRKILGEELLIKEIIKGGEYKRAMDVFIIRADFDRRCELLKAFRSVFGKEMDIFVDTHLKFRILKKSLKNEDSLRNEFEEIINLFEEYFGIQNLKEVLLSCDSDTRGFYLIHYLLSEKGNVNINLNIVRNILVESSEMKQFLLLKNRESKNIIQSAAQTGHVIIRSINFGEIMKFCSNYLEKHEIVEMLTSGDEFSRNALYLLFSCNSTERIIQFLDIIKNTLENDELFKNLLKGEDKYKRNIFHFTAYNLEEINFSFLSSYLCENEIKVLLIGRDKNGETILHCGKTFQSKHVLYLLEYSFEKLKVDKSQFEELILATNINGYTFLHQFVESYIDLGEDFMNNLMKSVKEKVSEEIFKELLRIRNGNGEVFLQVKNKFRIEHNERVIECCKTILEQSLIEELLKKNECTGEDNDSDDE